MSDCPRRREGDHFWICDRCGSLWSDMLAGLGWLPLSCPGRKSADYDPQPGEFDKLIPAEKTLPTAESPK